MNREQGQLIEWCVAADQKVANKPSVPSEVDAMLGMALIAEEFNELIHSIANQDVVKVADALGDLQYVIEWNACIWGIDLDAVFQEIHRSNMSKLQNGVLTKNASGKIIKPPTYSPADLKSVLDNQVGLLENNLLDV